MKDLKLFCTNCQKTFPIDEVHIRCDVCNEPLEVEMVQTGGIKTCHTLGDTMLDRYADFYPFTSVNRELSLGEGFTPLTSSRQIAQELGIAQLYFKNETQNPTWSFKDRGTLVGVQHAKKLGYRKIGTVSTGNMATSVAAYGSKAGLETFIFVSKTIAPEKLKPIAIYGSNLIKVEGDYGNLYFESLHIGKANDIYFINSDVPFRVEGSKSIAFELCEQLNFQVPDYVIVPTSAGGNIRGIEKGFREFHASGLISKMPTIICAQAQGCSPIYNAHREERDTISRVPHPETLAHAIENPFPPSGNQVLRMIRANGGLCVAVSDQEMLAAQALLASEGIFGQPESAVPLAVVRKLRAESFFKGDESIVCIVTGGGLKFTAALEEHDLRTMECKLEDLSSFIADTF